MDYVMFLIGGATPGMQTPGLGKQMPMGTPMQTPLRDRLNINPEDTFDAPTDRFGMKNFQKEVSLV